MWNTTTTLPETNSSPLKMDGWNTTFILGPGLFSGAFAVSFREGKMRWSKAGGSSLAPLYEGILDTPSSICSICCAASLLAVKLPWPVQGRSMGNLDENYTADLVCYGIAPTSTCLIVAVGFYNNLTMSVVFLTRWSSCLLRTRLTIPQAPQLPSKHQLDKTSCLFFWEGWTTV